jgi:hypothetical protein
MGTRRTFYPHSGSVSERDRQEARRRIEDPHGVFREQLAQRQRAATSMPFRPSPALEAEQRRGTNARGAGLQGPRGNRGRTG